MKVIISSTNDMPIYEQLYSQIASQILNGELSADFCLPPIRVISRELRISVITVKKAYEMLESDELIYTRAGKGCFVSGHAKRLLADKKAELATARLKRDITYYKGLGLTIDELVELIKKEY